MNRQIIYRSLKTISINESNCDLGSARLEQENGHLAEVKVYEVFGLVGHVRAEVASDDAVPGRVVLLVELLLDVCGDVFLDVILVECLKRCVHGIVLHLL